MGSKDGVKNSHRGRRLFMKRDGRPAEFFLHPSISDAQLNWLRAEIEVVFHFPLEIILTQQNFCRHTVGM